MGLRKLSKLPAMALLMLLVGGCARAGSRTPVAIPPPPIPGNVGPRVGAPAAPPGGQYGGAPVQPGAPYAGAPVQPR